MYCCFTGHRPYGIGIKKENIDSLKQVLSDVIDTAISDGYTDFYCGMAQGIDTYAAEILIDKMRENAVLKLHAVLPCPEQDLKWTKEEKKHYEEILSHTDSRTIISPFYTKTCMLTRNRFMVDNSERVIAVWNGSVRGGTAYTVRYAKKENKEIHLIRPKDLSIEMI